ncbi:cupin domain-containing protein [Orrella sp. JC864]|uniref:cupin domain-containing protein n=1 Tax=Orrella sp. JC864 TaxID=3120298 RepID=UPI00300A6FF6
MEADRIIEKLGLAPHPEGGHYRQTWIAPSTAGRPSGTSILFLLKEGEVSHWHRIDATEIWHFHAGAPLVLETADTTEGPASRVILGPDVLGGHAPQAIVAPHAWQSARSTGKWTLVGCTVSPAFRFEGFELAPPGLGIPAK